MNYQHKCSIYEFVCTGVARLTRIKHQLADESSMVLTIQRPTTIIDDIDDNNNSIDGAVCRPTRSILCGNASRRPLCAHKLCQWRARARCVCGIICTSTVRVHRMNSHWLIHIEFPHSGSLRSVRRSDGERTWPEQTNCCRPNGLGSKRPTKWWANNRQYNARAQPTITDSRKSVSWLFFAHIDVPFGRSAVWSLGRGKQVIGVARGWVAGAVIARTLEAVYAPVSVIVRYCSYVLW